MVSLVTNRNENSETQGLPPGVFSEMSGFRTENRRHDVGYGVGCPCNRMNSSLKRPPDGNIVFCLILFDETDYEPQTASADARPGLHPRDPRGTENLFAVLAGRQPPHDGDRRGGDPRSSRCRRHAAARSVTRLHDPRRRRGARAERPCRPGGKELRRSDDRLALLQEKPGRGALQPTDALVPRRLRPCLPSLRRRIGLPFHHRPGGHAPHRGRMRCLLLPSRLPGRRTLCRTRQGFRFREPVLQLVREHLHHGPDHGAQPRKADLPPGARRARRRLQTGHNGGRSRRLSGALPARQRRNARTARRFRPLSQARGAGRAQPVADARARA